MIEPLLLKKKLKIAKKLDIRIVSGSMLPVLAIDSQYSIEDIPDDFKPQRFQIFVYWNGSILIGHYFWSQFVDRISDNQEYWVFKSLSNSSEDFPVKKENIIGYIPIEIPKYIRWKVILISIFQNIRQARQ